MDIRNNSTFTYFEDLYDKPVEQFIQNLISWSQNKENAGKPVQILLNSSGGGVLTGLALYAFIGELRANGHKVTIKALGRAGSAACIALQAADVRIIAPNSDLLVHAVIPVAHPAGTPHGVQQWELDRSEELTKRTMAILTSRSKGKVTMDRVMSETLDKVKDWWVTSAQALELGLVDKVESPPLFEDFVDEDASQSSDSDNG